MSKPLVERIPFVKILIVLVVIFGVSLGMCGVSAVLGVANSSHMGRSVSQILGFSFVIEIAGMVLSSVGLVVTVIAWAILGIAASSSRNVAPPQQLFNESSDRRKDEDGKR
jgi:hypothetical protein